MYDLFFVSVTIYASLKLTSFCITKVLPIIDIILVIDYYHTSGNVRLIIFCEVTNLMLSLILYQS